MGIVNGLPRGTQRIDISRADIEQARVNNQFVIFGASPKLVGNSIIVFLEYVQGTNITVKDINGNSLTGVVPAVLDVSAAPIRLDGGVELAGTVVVGKGFYIQKNSDLEV